MLFYAGLYGCAPSTMFACFEDHGMALYTHWNLIADYVKGLIYIVAFKLPVPRPLRHVFICSAEMAIRISPSPGPGRLQKRGLNSSYNATLVTIQNMGLNSLDLQSWC